MSEGMRSGTAAAAPAVQLCMTPDALKDQTYFLSHLSQGQLARLAFPLGPLTKREVRALAQHVGLATQSRKDSQGLCFLGKVKFSEFIKARPRRSCWRCGCQSCTWLPACGGVLGVPGAVQARTSESMR